VDGEIGADAIDAEDPADRERLAEAIERLRGRGMVEGEAAGPAKLTASGLAVRKRLLAARQRSLNTLVADWEPESPAVDAMIERLCEELSQSEPPLRETAEPAEAAL
jgi:Mn-dependent DtxR family transcriptional regulator